MSLTFTHEFAGHTPTGSPVLRVTMTGKPSEVHSRSGSARLAAHARTVAPGARLVRSARSSAGGDQSFL